MRLTMSNVNKIRKKEMLCTKKRYRAFFYVTNSKKYEENGKKGLTNRKLSAAKP